MGMRRIPLYVRFNNPPEPNGEGNSPGDGGTPKPGGNDHGFPADTPVVEMTLEQQANYWKFHARKHEGKARERADYDDQKALADKWREHEQNNKAPEQKVIDQHVETARAAERAKLAPRLVRAEFKAEAAARVPEALLDAFLEDINHTTYLLDNGEVDVEKVKKRVTALSANAAPQKTPPPNHQGYRSNAGGATSVDNGRALFESRHAKK